jgi:hypothetical protein
VYFTSGDGSSPRLPVRTRRGSTPVGLVYALAIQYHYAKPSGQPRAELHTDAHAVSPDARTGLAHSGHGGASADQIRPRAIGPPRSPDPAAARASRASRNAQAPTEIGDRRKEPFFYYMLVLYETIFNTLQMNLRPHIAIYTRTALRAEFRLPVVERGVARFPAQERAVRGV